MIPSRLLPVAAGLAILLRTALLPAQEMPAAPVGSWAGAVGPVDGVMVPDPAGLPVEFFDQGIAGTLSVRFGKPSRRAPHGTYTAVLQLQHGDGTVRLRHRGTPEADGSIDEVWSLRGRSPLQVAVSLARSPLDPAADFLQGTIRVGTSTHPVFLSPLAYHARFDPVPSEVEGTFNFFLLDDAINLGSGTGQATVRSSGSVRLRGSDGDGTRFSANVPLLRTGAGRPFFAMTTRAGRDGLVGGWAAWSPASEVSDWEGRARFGVGGLRSSTLLMSAFSRPSRGEPSHPWTRGMLHLELGGDFFVANGGVSFDARSRLVVDPRSEGEKPGILNGANASGVSVDRIAFKANNGSVSGMVSYFHSPSPMEPSRRERGRLVGLLNPKTGMVHGAIKALRSTSLSGVFEIAPAE
jgi:hypothetical protein